MCVIAICDEKPLTVKMIEAMYDANPNGAGLAWREVEKIDGKDVPIVKWEKGLSRDAIKQRVVNLPTPYVAHFRIPTCGGARKDLCHPFPIEKAVSCALKGSIQGYVLFHNGHWANWKQTVIDGVVRGYGTLPPEKWSDSRAMAWAAAHYGLGMLELIDEKACAFGPDKIEVFNVSSWTHLDGLWVSNRGWEGRNWRQTVDNEEDWSVFGNTKICQEVHCMKQSTEGSAYCQEHQTRRICLFSTCNKHRMQGSSYCVEHESSGGKAEWICKYEGCIKAHISGMRFCDEHRCHDQTTCIHDRCTKPVVPESVVCYDHVCKKVGCKRGALRNKILCQEHTTIEVTTPQASPFCNIGKGHADVSGRDAQREEVQSGTAEVRPNGEGSQQAALVDDIAAFKWARSLNPKGKRIATMIPLVSTEEQERLDRVEKAAKGIQIVGPI